MIQLTNKRLLAKKQDENLNQIRQKKQELIEKHNTNVKKMNEYNKLNIQFTIKDSYNSIIPLKLYTSWHTKDLPPLMRANYENLKASNPEFEHHLFDENECREFIKNNFEEDVLNAYDKLVPCAYKCDLWRYCVLYITGGVYLDIKYNIFLREKNYQFHKIGKIDYFKFSLNANKFGFSIYRSHKHPQKCCRHSQSNVPMFGEVNCR
jgi:mannosyltransferase OCH1-like enzyme